ncbi:LysR substrate-binding domain-containing protein [Acinetobacter shaoyimingii]|uniref:LysR family transcriptional regulator n=1 Tax=Acinetobacter shaoyimingii TaxID=2715164 RepID=A0A6G8RWY3_9GAMM|nr:LysR substrate-binding domain-containing protein [Acinetobacter shaoyimingii]NHB57809.1 LysR family transcriptional regulator [Acinetobacter shaoyimingii]QIO06414.1 LysR family transcriptional regulator [Acinetobacter shaoyimingii]
MQNLNDYYYFVQVVKYQGFTRASEALGITKSKLSRRITDLEDRLGVRFIQRNTRKFTVTEIGQKFYEYCLKILEDVNIAENFIQSTLSDEPSGLIKVSCPIALVEMPVGEMIANFMQKYPQVHIDLVASNHRVDLIDEGVDLAIRVRNTPLADSDLIVRDLDAWEHVLVAVPSLLKRYKVPMTLEELNELPSIGFHGPKQSWRFKTCSKESEIHEIEFQPRLKTDNFSAMKAAVMKGVGIASLPKVYVWEELRSGTMIELLPEWHLPKGVIHIAYVSRHGMLPSIRLLLEYLIEEFKRLQL